MRLTARQRAFLEKMLDVYYGHQRQPVHYSTLAHALGVAKSTAYEMLKLLEQKGYVSSEYHLADDHTGPGRSMILFQPTMKTLRTFRHLLGEDARDIDWEVIKHKVLERLAAEGLPNDEDLLYELVAAIPESRDSISYCCRVIAASLLSLRSQFVSRVQASTLFRSLAGGEASSLAALDLLPGFALGFHCALHRDPSWMSRLAECAERYQAYLHQMDEEALRGLVRFSRDLVDALQLSSRSG